MAVRGDLRKSVLVSGVSRIFPTLACDDVIAAMSLGAAHNFSCRRITCLWSPPLSVDENMAPKIVDP